MEASNKNLIYFERLHTQIVSLKALNNQKVQVMWVEGDGLQKFDFRISNAFTHVKDIVEKFQYENNFPDILGNNIKNISDQEKQKIIQKRILFCNKKIKTYETLLAKANNEISLIEKSDPIYEQKTVKQSEIISDIIKTLTMWKQYNDDIHTIEINRHDNIPTKIQNHHCWYDCWYDESIRCYISFNFEFLKQYSFDFNEDIIKFKKQITLPNVSIIPEQYVGFIDGYPVILQKYVNEFFKDKIESDNSPSIIIPNVTNDMLNDKLMSKWHGVSISMDQKTESFSKIPVTLYYYLSKGSRIILTNNVRCRYSQKERIFLESRDVFPKKHKPFLP